MKDRVNPRRSVRSLFDPTIIVPAIGDSFRKLHPRTLVRNPVMFVVEIVTVLVTILYLRDLLIGGTGGENLKFTFQIIVWLWITLLFANFAEAVAEGRGKAQAATLRKARTDTRAKRLIDSNGRSGMKDVVEGVSAVDLQIGDVVLVEASDLIPSDGDVIEGIASIDESAITGESAPVALAIDRVNLAQDIDRARLAAETDRLRAALLTSISHDLRTPLASILDSASSLVAHGHDFDATIQASLMRTILEEAERLNRFIGNLLDMTKLESGPLRPQTGAADLSDIVGATLHRADKILQNHTVEIKLESNLPLLDLDMVLMEQVLFNLFDNAAKYAPQGPRITVTARHEDGSAVIRVLDEGEGIPEADLERIFDKLYRVRRSDRQRAGTGLGLAICRGFVEAMGGSITAANRIDRVGAVFTVTLPVPVTPRLSAEALS
jgi:K+-sensing histidine kinase KdpD